MTTKRVSIVSILIFVLLASITGCGNNTAVSADQTATEQQSSVQEVLPTADPNASVDSLIGSWIDINAEDRFANITKTDSGFEYEDNEGKYTGTFENGVLKIKISDMDTADVFFDSKTGNMFATYQENITEFKKKP